MKPLVQADEFGRSVLERYKRFRVDDVIGSTLNQQTLVALDICNPTVVQLLLEILLIIQFLLTPPPCDPPLTHLLKRWCRTCTKRPSGIRFKQGLTRQSSFSSYNIDKLSKYESKIIKKLQRRQQIISQQYFSLFYTNPVHTNRQ